MKPPVIIAIVAVLFIVGLVGGYLYLAQPDGDSAPAETSTAIEPAGDSTEHERAGGDRQETLHGKAIEIPDNPVLCKIHHVPEVVDPFCSPELVESRGWCGGHDVPEALCTRCSPVLIAAFKAEDDWCAEHELPESQCLVCNPPTEEG